MTDQKSDRDLIADIAKQQNVDPEILLRPQPEPVSDEWSLRQAALMAARKAGTWEAIVKEQDELLRLAIAKWGESTSELEKVAEYIATLNPLVTELVGTLYADDPPAWAIDVAASKAATGRQSAVVPVLELLRLGIARAEHLQRYGRGNRKP